MSAPDVPTVLLHVWGVRGRDVPRAVLRMATGRRQLAGTPGLRFRKLLGTGSGRTFTARDADPRRWALLTVWDDDAAADGFERGHRVLRSWQRVATERLVVRLRPVSSRGEWSGHRPFGDPRPRRVDGPVASITRARIAPRKALTFWRAVPPVSADLHQVPGLRLALGVGEAPVGLQGTFSLWDSAQALTEFAHRREPHVEAVRRTALEGWYVEELFARFEVLDVAGELGGARDGR
ncbi:monooxygenase [Angustibacter peucedani]